MRGENGVAVKKSSTKKTIEDVKSINKNNNKKSLDNKKVSRTIRKKVKCELTSENIDLFHEGKHYESYGFMGAHCVSEKRKKGVRFTTWAPRAKRMYVVGEFSDFKIKDEYEMEKVSDKGIWSIFIEGLNEGEKYKYAIENIYGHYNLKSDPYAFKSENRPNTASIVGETDKYKWNDKSWMLKRKRFNEYDSIFSFTDGEEYNKQLRKILLKGTYVTIRFNGNHKDSPSYYDKLLKYIKKNKYEIADDSIEIALIDFGLTTKKSEFITEIQILVK